MNHVEWFVDSATAWERWGQVLNGEIPISPRVLLTIGLLRAHAITRIGKLEQRVPQDRQGCFSTEPFDITDLRALG